MHTEWFRYRKTLNSVSLWEYWRFVFQWFFKFHHFYSTLKLRLLFKRWPFIFHSNSSTKYFLNNLMYLSISNFNKNICAGQKYFYPHHATRLKFKQLHPPNYSFNIGYDTSKFKINYVVCLLNTRSRCHLGVKWNKWNFKFY